MLTRVYSAARAFTSLFKAFLMFFAHSSPMLFFRRAGTELFFGQPLVRQNSFLDPNLKPCFLHLGSPVHELRAVYFHFS